MCTTYTPVTVEPTTAMLLAMYQQNVSVMTEPLLAIPSILAARGLPSVSYILQGPGTGRRRKEGVCVAYAAISQAGGPFDYREACWGEKCVCTLRTSSPFTSCFIVRIVGLHLWLLLACSHHVAWTLCGPLAARPALRPGFMCAGSQPDSQGAELVCLQAGWGREQPLQQSVQGH